MNGLKIVIASLLLIISGIVQAATIHVPTMSYPTIQSGIDAASDGYTVIVADGIYKGIGNVKLDFKGKSIVVQSENGAANCIIDCENSYETPGFYFHSGEDPESVVDGFTIRNGQSDGGGVFCRYASSPAIKNCIIKNNTAYSYGGGIFCWEGSSPIIMNNIITGNSAPYGGGINCAGVCSPVITNNVIAKNTASYSGGAISCSWGASLKIINNTIADNSASDYASGIYCARNCSLIILNSILWNNGSDEVYFNPQNEPNIVTISHSDVHGGQAGIVTNNNGTLYWSDGNISSNSSFVDANNSDYHLANSSPCIGAGVMTSDVPVVDIEGNSRPNPPGSNSDIGAYENSLGSPVITNRQPNRPTNTSPMNGSTGLTLTPMFNASPFSDPDLGDIHTASQWQVTTIPDNYSSSVFDNSVDTQNLTQIIVPSGKLEFSTIYYWHVRYHDNHENWSEWSVETSFTTLPGPNIDLVIKSEDISFHAITLDNQVLNKANEIAIAAKIRNEGSTNAEDIIVEFLDETGGEVIGTTLVSKLESNTSAYVGITWKLNSNIQNHIIKVTIGPSYEDSKPENNEAKSLPISIYYVNSNPFDLGTDAYSFPNWGLEDFEVKQYIADLIAGIPVESWWKIFAVPILAIWGAKMEIGGHCYGMSSTSILYRHDPSLKPASVKNQTTYQMEKSIDVMTEIKKHQRSQLTRPLEIWNQIETNTNSPRDEYVSVFDFIKSGEPVMLIMSNAKQEAHAVVAYKIVELGDYEKKVYIYDNEIPYKPGYIPCAEFVTFDLISNSYSVAYFDSFNLVNKRFDRTKLYDEFGYSYVIARYPTIWSKSAFQIIEAFIINFINQLRNKNVVSLVLACPANATIIDQYGRKTGYIDDMPINEIPGASMEEHAGIEIYYMPADLNYVVETTGTDSGVLDLYYMIPKGNCVSGVIYEDIPVNTGSKTSINIGQNITDYTMRMDNDYDGIIDETRTPNVVGGTNYFAITLTKGWNLISLCLDAVNAEVASILNPIQGFYQSIWSCGSGWQKYIPSGPASLNDLGTMEVGKGYLIYMNDASTLNIMGSTISNTEIPLSLGWNLVGYSFLEPISIEDATISLPYNTRICAYNSEDGTWLTYIVGSLDFINNLHQLKPGKGYWIYTKQDCIWKISHP